MQDVWKVFSTLTTSESQGSLNAIRKIMLDKYKLVILREIECNILPKCTPYNSLSFSKRCMEALTVTSTVGPHDEEMLSDEFGNLRRAYEFLCTDFSPDKMSNLYNNELNDIIKRDLVSLFLKEFGSNYSDCPQIKEAKRELLKLMEDRGKELMNKLLPLKYELIKPRHSELYDLLVKKYEQDNQTKLMLESKTEKDTFLKILFNLYVKEIKHQPTFDKALLEQTFKVVWKELLSQGPVNKAFRELVAFVCDINILVYNMREDGSLMLVDSHNQRANSVLHILRQSDKFVQLSLNKTLAEMIETHTYSNELLHRILLEVNSIEGKELLDDYIKKMPSTLKTTKDGDKSASISVRIEHIYKQDTDIEFISGIFKDEKQLLIRTRLEKLKNEFSGYESVLHSMALHFKYERKNMSVEELSFIVNLLLKFNMSKFKVIPKASWIIAVHPHSEWLVELAALKLELYLKQVLTLEMNLKWKKCLSDQHDSETVMLFLQKLDETDGILSVDSIEEVLNLIANIPKAHIGLSNIDLCEWKYYLKDKFWVHQFKTTGHWSEQDLKTASYYLVKLENLFGLNFCEKILDVFKKHSKNIVNDSSKHIVITALNLFSNGEEFNRDSLMEDLATLSFDEWETQIKRYVNYKNKRDVSQLTEIMRNSSNTSKNILEKIDAAARSVSIINQLIAGFTTLKEDDYFKKILCFHKDNFESYEALRKNTLPLVVIAVKLKTGLNLYDTQKLALTILQMNPQNILAQVSTGEGKSYIVCVLAIIKALNGQKVDVITSSHVLAERDAQNNKEIYELCGVTVGHNCSEQLEERKKIYSDCQVVYGELASFQRDYLLDRVYNRNVLGDRSFQTVIIDEVDSMLLDKGNNTLYLSHEIPGLNKINLLFLTIWIRINVLAKSDQFESTFRTAALKDELMLELFGYIKKDHIREIDDRLTDGEINNIWDFLIKNQIITNKGQVRIVDEHELIQFNDSPVFNAHIKYLFQKIFEMKRHVQIPNYLQAFVEEHLEEWINSCMRAMAMENGRDYVVDVDRSGTSSDRDPNITILDLDTGTDLASSQWDQGLHQFLQLKHGCKLSPVSLKAVFISNVSYLKLYETLNGLTGTLGSEKDRDLLKSTYDVDFVTIPTAKVKNFREESSILCSDMKEWMSEISKEAETITRQGRSILIICETSKDVFCLEKCFSRKNVHTYTRDYESLSVAENLCPGKIIISTNLAGRGTDIKLSKELIDAGGLHVCLTFLPINSRIEEQAFGRAARKGEPGSARIIFRSTDQSTINSGTKVIDLKKQRDVNDIMRLVDVRKYHENHIKLEEEWFGKFLEKYKGLNKSVHLTEEIKSVLLQTYLDQWAYWLESNSKLITSVEDPSVLEKSFNSFISKSDGLCSEDFKIWSAHVTDPFQLLKLGLVFISTNNDYDTAIWFFEQIILNEPYLSEVASYYKVYAVSQKYDHKPAQFLSDLEVVARKLQEQVNSSIMAANLIDNLKDQSCSIIQIDSFKKQQVNESKIYQVYLESINDMIGRDVVLESFIKYSDCPGSSENKPEVSTDGKPGQSTEWNLSKIFSTVGLGLHDLFKDQKRYIRMHLNFSESAAYNVYLDLVEKNILKQTKVQASITKKDFMFVREYGMLPQETCDFFNENVGLNESQLFKNFKTSFPKIPTVESLWKELIKNQILRQEQQYSFLNVEELDQFNPSLTYTIQQLDSCIPLKGRNMIWLYPQQPKREAIWKVFNKLYFKCKIGQRNYKLLKMKGIIEKNKQGRLHYVHNDPLTMFDSITEQDFVNVGINGVVVSEIISELILKNVIYQSTSQNEKCYYLAKDLKAIHNIELSCYKGYTEEVKALLCFCFSFRIALQKVINTSDSDGLCFELQRKVHREVVNELYDRGIIRNVVATTSVIKTLAYLYPAEMTRKDFDNIFEGVFDENQRVVIIECLIKNQLIKIRNPKSSNGQPTKYYINEKLLNEANEKFNLDDYDSMIIWVLLHQAKLTSKKYHVFVENCLKEAQGALQNYETLGFSLVPLLTILEKQKLPISELPVFSLNGFDQLLVAEEKRFTLMMKLYTSLLTVVAAAEFVAGCFLTPYLPRLGVLFIEQGISNVIYVISCLWSGYFSKFGCIANQISTLFMSLSTGEYLFKPTFGQSSTKFTYLKEKCSSLMKKIFGSSTAAQAETSVMYKTAVKQIIKTTAIGVGSTVAMHSIEPVLREYMTQLIHKNIEDILTEHSVRQTIIRLHQRFGEKQSKRILCDLSKEVLEVHQRTNGSILNKLFISSVDNIISEQISKWCKGNKLACRTNAGALLPILKNIVMAGKGLLEVNRVVRKIFDEIEKCLLSILEQTDSPADPDHKSKDFAVAIGNNLKDILISFLSGKIDEDFIDPVLLTVKVNLYKYSSLSLGWKNAASWNNKGSKIFDINKIYSKETVPQKILKEVCADSEYDRCLNDMFKKTKSKKIFLEMMKKNCILDDNCVNLCCSVIPLLLTKEGVDAQGLNIVFDVDGTRQRSLVSEQNDEQTIIISADTFTDPNLRKKNKIFIKDLVDRAFSSILESYPNLKVNSSSLHNLLIKALEDDIIQKSVDMYRNKLQTDDCNSKINAAIEHDRPCQHLHPNGKWVFNRKSDVDLREDKFIALEEMEDHILLGFNTAINKINNFICRIQDNYPKLVLEDLTKTKHDMIPSTKKTSTSLFHCYCIGYELFMPLFQTDGQAVNVRIVLTLKRAVEKIVLFCPLSPHIMYEMHPVSSKHVIPYVKGHVLLNIEPQRHHSPKNCLSAGDLIMPTGFTFHNLKHLENENDKEKVMSKTKSYPWKKSKNKSGTKKVK